MSDDLKARVVKALCANDGLGWPLTGLVRGLEDSYQETADAVLEVIRPIHGELKASLDDTLSAMMRLSDERDELAAEKVRMSDLLRNEKERADAAIKREETVEEHATELGQYARRMEQERDAAKAASDAWKELAERNDETSGPLRANLRRAERERDDAQRQGRAWRDEGERLREELATRADSDDVDDLKATIVSQAREIARLKGESA